MGHLSEYLNEHPRLEGMSFRAFGRLIGVSPDSARQIMLGLRPQEDETLLKISAALGADITRLRQLAERDRLGPFEPPPWYDLLNKDERTALNTTAWQFLRSGGREYLAERLDPEGATVTPLRGRQRQGEEELVDQAAYKPPPDEG